MKVTRIFSLGVLGLALSVTSVARADVIDLAYLYVEAGGTMSATYNGAYYGQGYNWANGIQKMATQNPSGALASLISSPTWAVCSEITQDTTFSYTTYSVDLLQNTRGAAKSNMIRQLWGEHYDASWESSTPIYYGGSYGGFVSGQPAATAENQNALSLTYAVLEILYDFDGTLASLNLSSGLFTMSAGSDTVPPTVATVQGWLNSLVLPSQYSNPLPILVEMTSATQQNLITEIPEPASVSLLVLGGLALLGRKR
ncbi:MAG: PEP-CTERM sorting domain-containing protein [Phycisphaeraceae bacterium]|nr:PEP-CTERM sorting domain-containing protein [Phycisphaeraceae bacterium]